MIPETEVFRALTDPDDSPQPSPPHRQADVVASDGGTVHLRPITPDDADALLALHSRLSDRTRYLRFFGPYPVMPRRDVERFTTVDHHDRVALVAVLGDDIIAVGRFDRLEPGGTSAEVALVVEDAHQGRGLGSILLEHLAAAGREQGVARFVAEVLAENRQMARIFRDAGYQISRAFEEGVLHLEFGIDPTEESLAVARAREQAAEARSVHNLLHPGSVAVIGASSDHDKVGHAVLRNLLQGDFAGSVYPVNADRRSVRGVRAYPTVLDIPDAVDLAVVAVPAADVDEVFDQCLAKAVRALVVLTSGFSEAGQQGVLAEHALVTQARTHGMRVVGPNALGVANTDPAIRLNATLAPTLPGQGRTGFFAQSGALGIAILAGAANRGLGLSTFVSAGNRADLSGNDLLQYWQSDPSTDVVLLYLESFGNPRKFARLARRLARSKPIVAVKSGRHGSAPPRGLAATSVPIDEASVAALFEQSGVIRVESVAQLFDTALLLAHQPLPTGPRVAVVGNSTALGVLAADTARAQGLTLAADPVDVGGAAGPEQFAGAVRSVLDRDDVDALVVVFVPPVAVPGTAYARALREVTADSTIPLVSTFLAAEGVPDELAVTGPGGFPGPGSVPSYPSPERGVLALARVVRYAQWRARPVGDFVRPEGLHADEAAALVEPWVGDEPLSLPDERVARLLDCYGIGLVPLRRVHGVEEAVSAGIACDIGVQDDPSFGSLVSFGLAGVVFDLLGDRAYRAVPLSDVDAADLVRAPRAAPLLAGYRGAEPVDLAALEDLVLRVAALAEDLPVVRSLSLEPVLASPAGAAVAGASINVGRAAERHDGGPRRLR
ncbi:MAG: GNAT family N-acetyltransferase [Pseudonocardiaceae bacterium]|nr:GNAT family N-acetyltransferase [Pseudonocardiaceae bacterium]